MTDKPELKPTAPEYIWAWTYGYTKIRGSSSERCEENKWVEDFPIASVREACGAVQYTRTDISEAAIAERDAAILQRDEAENQLDSALHSVSVLEKRVAKVRNDALIATQQHRNQIFKYVDDELRETAYRLTCETDYRDRHHRYECEKIAEVLAAEADKIGLFAKLLKNTSAQDDITKARNDALEEIRDWIRETSRPAFTPILSHIGEREDEIVGKIARALKTPEG